MPVNYTQIQQQVRAKGGLAKTRKEEFLRKQAQAQRLLLEHGANLDELRERVESAATQDRNLRCAAPLSEALDSSHTAPVPDASGYPILLAADGSQINPNRHDPIEFAVINLGILRMVPGQAQIPQESVVTELFMFDDLDGAGGPLTEEVVALTRDLRERRELASLASREKGPQAVATLTDGPLELYREPRENAAFEQRFREYLDVLELLAAMNCITAGYVDKPRGDLVVRLLELTLYPPEELGRVGKERPLRGVRDKDLFVSLQPGQRTAVFAIHSQTAQRFRERIGGALGLCFFYINVGRPEHPWLARVELPWWVASQPEMVNLLQATLLQQCRQMGAKPYPYGLHRAHEIALVTFQEKMQVQGLIENELRRIGVEIGETSNKQSAKDLEGRTRMK